MKSRFSIAPLMLTLGALLVFFLPDIAAAAASVDPSAWVLPGTIAAKGASLAILAAGVVVNTSKTLRSLQGAKTAALKDMRAMNDKAAGENRDFTEDEAKTYGALKDKVDGINAKIEREQQLLAEEASSGLQIADNARIEGGEPASGGDPRRGFRSFGEFAVAVRQASGGGQAIDERLRIGAAAPSTFGNEGAGADGGFLVPPEYAREIFTYSLEQDSLLALADNYTVGGNSMVFPKDETTPWGTDGIRAYWQNEAVAGTQTKPKLGTTVQRLHKLMALVPLTDELLADAMALEQYITRKVGDSIRWKTNEAVLYGSGAGQPLGVLNSGAVVTITKDSGQATATLSPLNLANMIARLPPGSYARAVWLLNNDVLPALFTLSLGNYPIYVPAVGGGFKDSPYGMLLGRPVMVSQHANTFSSQGDVQLHDLKYWRAISKASGIETATSMHLYFDADATAFRTIFRVDGQPIVSAAITPAKGTNKLSPFIQLGAR